MMSTSTNPADKVPELEPAEVDRPGRARSPILQPCELSVGDGNGRLVMPSRQQILSTWFDGIDLIRHRERWLNVVNILFQLAAGALFVWHLVSFVTITSVGLIAIATAFLGIVYNTVWYHRHCAHKAFRFRSVWFARLFLWTNPMFLREEVYALPHRIHHGVADGPGDPHGPHMGWLGAFLAQDWLFRINKSLGADDYNWYRDSLRHIGLATNDHAGFLRTGSVERVGVYLTRVAFAQLFWSVIMFALGGLVFVTAWYGALFVIWFLIRDFQYRGHGGMGNSWRLPSWGKRKGWEFDTSCGALNQSFYGYLVAEWHDNHHLFPSSANLGFLRRQIDLAFWIIRAMAALGMVSSYIDSKATFIKKYRFKAVAE
jgi:fatty-acid desaturase